MSAGSQLHDDGAWIPTSRAYRCILSTKWLKVHPAQDPNFKTTFTAKKEGVLIKVSANRPPKHLCRVRPTHTNDPNLPKSARSLL